jgi:hypothetical protein
MSIFESIIDAVASVFEAFGISEESAEKYAKILVYGGIAVIVIIIVFKVIKYFKS